MLARFRSVLVHPGRKRLNGTVEVDETYIGGEEPGLAGGRAQGKKVLTGIAVEVREPKGIGRCRMALLEDGSAASLLPFVSDHVAPAATVITDAWMGYHGLAKLGYAHRRRSQRAARARGEDPARPLPAVHRVASLAKRWLLSTHRRAPQRTGPGHAGRRTVLPGRRSAGYANERTVEALGPLLGYLRGLGAVPLPPTEPVTETGLLLDRLGAYLASERGLAPRTVC